MRIGLVVLIGVLAAGLGVFFLMSASAREFRPDLQLEAKIEKTEYLPREPIVFTLGLQSFEPHIRICEIDWQDEPLVTLVGNNDGKECKREGFWFGRHIDHGPDMRMVEDAARQVVRFPAGSKTTSKPLNLLDVTGVGEELGNVFRCDSVELKFSLKVSWNRGGPESKQTEYTATKTIRIVQPTSSMDIDGLRLLDLCLNPPDGPFSDEDKNFLSQYGVPIVNDEVDLEDVTDFLLIIRDAFPGSIYGLEAAYLYAHWLYDEEGELIDTKKQAYQWVIDNYPDSWWAVQSKKALEELEK